MTREQRNERKRQARLRKAIEEGRAFRAKRLHDAHVRCFRRQPKQFVGPPRPSTVGNAVYAKWKYQNDYCYREYHLQKRNRTAKEVPLRYAREKLGIRNAPQEMVEAKRLHMLIKRKLGEMKSEINQ